jgi:hypothetical protein
VSALNRTKLAFAVIGLIIFAAGIRLDQSRLRWIGIAFVAVAWMLRFAKPRRGAGDTAPETDQDRS